ncbi:putative oxidoreductase [Natronocella acetinitrilica]|jgi:putative oxidoreductase|uniref:Oxidoreductase n=1 Tax=Natronocella acetinitrilica TaxID=414046 RepID=A0AAE3G2I0_9GAMM|nr:DoxX family protein [Natronocella acetinitrilica]MCP1673243.1 putative oxidoreductase [Natronocella acetinitrilica]
MLHALDDGIGKIVLRLTLGLLMLPHGIAKLGGVGGIQGMLSNAGLPEILAYGVFVGEILAPIMLIIGFYARWGAVLIVINMIFAIFLAHSHEILMINERGIIQLELQYFFLMTGVALIFTGPGPLSVNRG